MDESTPAIEETMNATFLSKVSIEAGYIEEENLENEILLEAKSITKSLNNQSEIFEITGTSANYNLIEYSLDKEHWNKIENPGKTIVLTEEFQEEGKYSIYIRDEVGNIKSIEIETEKLDKTIPEISITPTDNQESIELRITITDEKSSHIEYVITESKEEPTEWKEYTGEITYTVMENRDYYIWVKDEAGNVTYQIYSASTIDTKAPELMISNTLTDWGEKDTITIQATDDIIGISGISISTSEDTYNWEVIENTLRYETTKEIEENGTYYISVKDAYGHITTKSIVIDKIDSFDPVIENLSSDTKWGIVNYITVTLIDNELGLSGYQITKENIEPEEYISINGASYELKYKVTTNGTYYLWVKDVKGNITNKSIEVNKIDNTAPILSDIQNSSNGAWAKSITLSWEITEEESGIAKVEYSSDNNSWNELSKEEWNGLTRNNERNDTIYIRVTDEVGNVSNVKSTTMKIDTSASSASYSINSSTSGSNGWYKALSIKATLSDSRSGVKSAKYCTTTGSTCTPGTNASISNNAFTVTLGSNASAQKICTEVTDNAGNTSSTICSGTHKVDTTNPTAKISASSSGSNITVSASGSSDGHSGIASYQYSKDNKKWYTSTSASYTFTGLADGTYTVYVKVTDKSGRVSSAVSAKVNVKNYVYLYDYGTTNTNLVGNLVTASGSTISGTFSALTATSGWSNLIASGYWLNTNNGVGIDVTNQKICLNVSNLNSTYYISMSLSGDSGAYKGTANAKVYQIYLIPN